MKYNKMFRILGIAIILCLLVMAIPATPALAQAMSVNPTSGTAGTTVTVNGTGYTLYNGQTLYILFNYVFAQSAAVSNGTFSASFPVPASYTTAMAAPITVQQTSATYDVTNQIGVAVYFNVTARSITVTPTSRYVGEQVTVTGTGFAASSQVTFYWDNVAVTASATTTDTNGAFANATLTVPPTARGSHTIKAQDASNNSATSTVTVMPKITINLSSGAVGDTVTVGGTGFAGGATVTFYFDTSNVGTTGADTSGTFTGSTFTVPPTSRGSHTIKAQDNSANFATTLFTIGQKISITPDTGASGATVTVTGSGFSTSRTITLKYNAVPVTTSPASVITDTNGSFTASFTVPTGGAGTYPVEASDGTYTFSVNFVIVAGTTLSQTTGNVGSQVTINGTGFIPNASVTITYTSEPVVLTTTTTDSSGAFSVMVSIPPTTGGAHTITASDGTNTITSTFTVETIAPPIPVPLLPEMDSRTKSQAYFDWEDVEDPSGVTYTLQIASDADFTTIVLEKEGLTTSEYTLTKEEKLEQASKEEPYYWRARAVDGASNASDWTTPGSFQVGFIFDIPNWGLYTLYGVGGILLIVFGFWLGRRTAYY